MLSERDLFRKAALDRLSSPEQLDVLLRVTSPRAWLSLSVLGALLALTLVWAVFGTLPSTVKAEGILINPGGVFDVFAGGSGQVVELAVVEGDLVEEGQTVARIEQPDLQQQLAAARARVKEQQEQHTQLLSFDRQDKGLRGDSVVLRRAALADMIRFSEERLGALEEQMANEEHLLEQGLITKQSLLQTKQAYFSTKDQLVQARTELKQLSVTVLSDRAQADQQRTRSSLAISEAERSVARLEEQMAMQSLVRSPYRGRVVELRTKRGDVVHQGATVLSLQLSGQEAGGLQALIYVRPTDGKNVRTGMEARVSPSTAKKEEFGYLIGKVTYVSEFPSTHEGMMRVLSNDRLVNALSKEGAPFAVYAELLPDPESASGLRWSSAKGQALKVAAGTPCEASVTTRRRRPISLVIPLLREYSGL